MATFSSLSSLISTVPERNSLVRPSARPSSRDNRNSVRSVEPTAGAAGGDDAASISFSGSQPSERASGISRTGGEELTIGGPNPILAPRQLQAASSEAAETSLSKVIDETRLVDNRADDASSLAADVGEANKEASRSNVGDLAVQIKQPIQQLITAPVNNPVAAAASGKFLQQ